MCRGVFFLVQILVAFHYMRKKLGRFHFSGVLLNFVWFYCVKFFFYWLGILMGLLLCEINWRVVASKVEKFYTFFRLLHGYAFSMYVWNLFAGKKERMNETVDVNQLRLYNEIHWINSWIASKPASMHKHFVMKKKNSTTDFLLLQFYFDDFN